MMDVYEIIELFCEIVVVRLPVIENQRLVIHRVFFGSTAYAFSHRLAWFLCITFCYSSCMVTLSAIVNQAKC
jgi:hypothetical protein